MQFGRIHGIALILFGLLLISVQIAFAFTGKSAVSTSSHPEPTSTTIQETQPHGLGPLAGILGSCSLLGGLVVFATARRRDEPPPQRAVK